MSRPGVAAASSAAASSAASSGGAWPRLRIAHDQDPVDLAAAEQAAADLLVALGLPVDSENMVETPRRMARAYAEMLEVPAFDFTTFPNDEGYDELVLVTNIPVRSICEHHMLPFVGVAHVGYLPGDRILGLSKLARVVEFFAHRPQTQERLSKQVADCLAEKLSPVGVGVVIQAEHTCMTLRGVQAVGAVTVTSTLLGTLREDPAARAEFLTLTCKSKEAS